MNKKLEILNWPEEDNAMTISFETLKKSTPISMFNGKLPKRAPIKHYDFLDLVLNQIKNADNDAYIKSVYVAKNRTKHIELLDSENEGFVKAHAFENIITEILLPKFSDEEKTMKIAIQHSDKGISMYAGSNITTCSNFTVLGSSQRISTTGRKGMPYDKMLQVFGAWVGKMEEAWEINKKVIEELKTIQLSGNGQVQELIGDLLLAAVGQAYDGGDAPLNIGDVSKLSQDLLKNENFLQGQPMSAFDLLNFGTELLGTNQNNIDTKLDQLLGISQFIINKYNPELNKEIDSVYFLN